MRNFARAALLLSGIGLCLAQTENASAPASPHPLKQILIADSAESALKLTLVPDGGLVVVNDRLSFINVEDLKKRLKDAQGLPITGPLVESIRQVVGLYLRQHDFPIAEVVVPAPQSVANGEIRLAVLLGKFREIRVKGNRWFSESLVRDKLRVGPGGTIRFSELDDALAWANTNPFRRLQAKIEPVPDAVGEADLIVGVEERLPLRGAFSFDNGGNEILARSRYVAALTYGNLWGLDHQVSYQYVTTNKSRFYQGHAVDYRIPLPWRHNLQISASYLLVKPEFAGGLFTQQGKSLSADLRYSVPLRRGNDPAEAYVGLSFKESNNNLEFGGTNVLANSTDQFEVTGGFSVVRHDRRGAWLFAGSVNASPGHVNSRNNTSSFESARPGAKPEYVYGNLSFQRLLILDRGWQFTSRGVLQGTSGNLLGSDQLTIGGASTVRGFRENIYAGDYGFLLSNELLAPSWRKTVPFFKKRQLPSESRFVAFYDVAEVALSHRYPFDQVYAPLAGTGVGFRTTVGTNFSLNFDYGWQITHLPRPTGEHGQGHIKVVLAF